MDINVCRAAPGKNSGFANYVIAISKKKKLQRYVINSYGDNMRMYKH